MGFGIQYLARQMHLHIRQEDWAFYSVQKLILHLYSSSYSCLFDHLSSYFISEQYIWHQTRTCSHWCVSEFCHRWKSYFSIASLVTVKCVCKPMHTYRNPCEKLKVDMIYNHKANVCNCVWFNATWPKPVGDCDFVHDTECCYWDQTQILVSCKTFFKLPVNWL